MKLKDETRTCCGCGKSWTIPSCPVKVDPPHSCGKPDCNRAKRKLEKEAENG